MWLYKGRKISNLEDFPEGSISFIYRIINISKENNLDFIPYKYIGYKNIYSTITKKLGKKEIANLSDKRKSKVKQISKESNWLEYNSSCKPLLEDISKGDQIRKEILHICYSKIETTYMETKLLFENNVLEDPYYYNNNILGKFYKTK